ncbi:MAG TPA: hypothetical protein VJ873_09475, partial [bacterium]|nr:hypothetical protein [bacterium]
NRRLPKWADSMAITSDGAFYVEKIHSSSKKSSIFRCPHCLENLQDPGPAETNVLRACPVCERNLRRELCRKPLHELNQTEQFDLLFDELCLLTGAEDGLNHDYIRRYGRDSDVDADEIRLGKMISARNRLYEQRAKILAESQTLEDAFVAALIGYPNGDGRLSYQFENGRLLRQRALELSKTGAGPERVIPFQLDLVNATSWGAYHSTEHQREVIEGLKTKLANLNKVV